MILKFIVVSNHNIMNDMFLKKPKHLGFVYCRQLKKMRTTINPIRYQTILSAFDKKISNIKVPQIL